MIAINFNRLAVCVVVIAFFGRAITEIIFADVRKVTATYGRPATLKFYSNVSMYPQYAFKSIFVDLGGEPRETVATGGATSFNREISKHFGDSGLTAYQFDDQANKILVFNLRVSNVDFNDNVRFIATVVYQIQGATGATGVQPSIEHSTAEIELEVLGGPLKCGEQLPTTTTLNAVGTSTMKTVLCGKPIPTVTWSDGNKTLTTASYKVDGNSKYNFTLTLSNVTSSMCGSTISFKATGYSDDVDGETELNIIFKPSVTFNLNYRVNSSCIRLEWISVDVGTCGGLVYHTEYLNSSGSPILTINHNYPTSGYTYCTDNITGIIDTRIRAAFNGEVGEWNREVVSLVAPTVPTQTPAVQNQKGGDDDDWKTGAIAGGVVGGLVLIALIILIIWCCCCGRKDKEGKGKPGGAAVSSLGFHYKKNSKKKAKNGSVVVTEPPVIYATAEKVKKEPNELQFFDPTEFGVDTERPIIERPYEKPNAVYSHSNSTYDNDDFANRPSVLI